jgi:hypothetical protein
MGGEFFTPNSRVPGTRRVYAHLLNDWQILYGEDITDAAALEVKLRAEGKLEENQSIEPKLRVPVIGERFVCFRAYPTQPWAVSACGSNGPLPSINSQRRAIVGTRKRKYLKVPLDERYGFKVEGGTSWIWAKCVLGAEIVEE